MDRPARVQVAKAELDEAASERALEQQQGRLPSAVFNTWYGKWAGGDKQKVRFRSPYRCDVERDSGWTRSQGPYFCIWFARGACYKGFNCDALHRIPQRVDATQFGRKTDCFGRMKYADYREDMAGVGSLLKENKTLFVGYFEKGSGSGSTLTEQVRKQFMEWGDVERVKLGKNSSIAFVTYSTELNAQFAKEAMSNQSITGKETLTVRWSRDSASSTRNKTLQSSSEEEWVRNIVRRVIRNRQDAEQTATRHETAKRRVDETAAAEHTGLISGEAAVRLRELKRRKTVEPEEPPETQHFSAAAEASTREANTAKPAPRKGTGLVDYD